MRPIQVLHCITDLSPDGAQRTLLRLVSNLPRSEFNSRVVSLMSGGHLVDAFRKEKVEVDQLGMSRGMPGPLVLKKLRSIIREYSPDVIQGWMYHGNLAATAGAWLSGAPAVRLWNIRRCLHNVEADKFLTRAVVRASSVLSGTPHRIVYCVSASADQHEQYGFSPEKRCVIPNGFDVQKFRPFFASRAALRLELGLSPETPLVGVVGRYHQQKDYPSFLRAAQAILRQMPETHFVLVGRDVTLENREARQLIESLGISTNVHLLGERQDVPAIVSALDVFLSSSVNEGFSNVVGEAMACGVPCVATDVGASRELLAGVGSLVPPSRPDEMASSVLMMLKLQEGERLEIGRKGRQKIEAGYSLENMVHQYAELYRSCVGRKSLEFDEQLQSAG